MEEKRPLKTLVKARSREGEQVNDDDLNRPYLGEFGAQLPALPTFPGLPSLPDPAASIARNDKALLLESAPYAARGLDMAIAAAAVQGLPTA